jgi:MFS superfamily sulfate permease-like transporter
MLRINQNNQTLADDLGASFVVFLVALPLCMAIAIASGVSPMMGLITGIVGGSVVGAISGSPLQVSGPAAGLTPVVWEIVQKYGIEMLGPILLLAGLFQFLAGVLKLGQFFRAMSPAVIYGMLAGIGILIFASQFHVLFDAKSQAHGLENLIAIPYTIFKGLFTADPSSNARAAGLGLVTIIALSLWNKFKPHQLRLIPGALVGVIVATILAGVLEPSVHYINVPRNLFAAIRLPTLDTVQQFPKIPFLIEAAIVALIASAESLLSATALDRMHQGDPTDFDKELAAQGIGNVICGALGAIPMTGVIARSSVNVNAGAKTRLSTVLHGVWILAIVVVAPHYLNVIPTASLAAILVFTGYKMIKAEHVRRLLKYGRIPVLIYFATLIGIVVADLLTGVLIGVVLTILNLIYRVSYLAIHLDKQNDNRRVDVYLEGMATFISLPRLTKIFEQLPFNNEVHVHCERLIYVDHSCLDYLLMWQQQHQKEGRAIVIKQKELMKRNQNYKPLRF